MAKKSIVERNKKREHLTIKYAKKRESLKASIKLCASLHEKFLLRGKFQLLPKNSFPSRVRHRCWNTGRARGYYRDFGVSRHVLREMAHSGFLPGVTKYSW